MITLQIQVALMVAFYIGMRYAQYRNPGEMTEREYKRLRKASQWRSKVDPHKNVRTIMHELYGPLEGGNL